MSGELCKAQGCDLDELRLVCILPAGHEDWHQDGPERWWKTIPNEEEQ